MLVRELTQQVLRGEVAGVPSAYVIRLSASGAVSVEGPVAADGRTVLRAAQLLESLLSSSEIGGPPQRVPGGLKLVLARALGTLDLPPFPSLEAFSEALSRFCAADGQAAVVALVLRWAEADEARAREPMRAVEAPRAQLEPFSGATELLQPDSSHDALTVSDIRRARRATGLPLSIIAERSGIPLGMLRQLEWGYVRNWPTGPDGHVQLMRYARATGLDERVVLATLTPFLAAAERDATQASSAPAPAGTVERAPARVVDLELVADARGRRSAQPRRDRAGRSRIAAAAAALLALTLLPIWWAQSIDREAPRNMEPAAAGESGALPPPANSAQQSNVPGDSRAESAVGIESSARAASSPPKASDGRAQRSRSSTPAKRDIDNGYRLASDGGAYSPSFDAVGSAMFYHGETGEGGTALIRADTDSRGAVLRITRIVDDDARSYHIRPSPDGSQIAFDSDRDGERGVYVAAADGTNVRRVSPEGFAAVPSWSPDGRRLSFVRAEADRPRVWQLWILDLATGDLQQVTRHRYGQPWGGSWFPDGRRIAYSHEDRIVVHDLQSGRDRVYPSPRKDRLVRTPAVSPDGQRIIFQLQRDGAWLLELSDGSMRRVLDDPTAEEYTWAPDGKRVAFHSRRSGGWSVWVMASR